MNCSVLLPVHAGDRSDFLLECLQSLECQTWPAAEIVLVEDGPISEDLSSTITSAEQRLPLTRHKLSANQGLAVALNEGLAVCRHSLVARMDADDACFPERLQHQIEFLRVQPETDIVGTHVVEIDNTGQKGATRGMPTNHENILADLWTCPLLHPTVMFRKEKILEIGGYDSSLRRRQDYELWFRCAQHGLRFANIPETLLYYRFEPSTHKKQSPKLAFQQGMIGFRGASSLGFPAWKRLACFLPFARSLLPASLQHLVYTALRRFDPRQRASRS